MSGGTACHCPERHEPLVAAGNRPPRLWRVTARHENRSAFNGYRSEWSRYSAIVCLACGASWRTPAPYVAELLDCSEEEFNISPGRRGYDAFMVEQGRHNPK